MNMQEIIIDEKVKVYTLQIGEHIILDDVVAIERISNDDYRISIRRRKGQERMMTTPAVVITQQNLGTGIEEPSLVGAVSGNGYGDSSSSNNNNDDDNDLEEVEVLLADNGTTTSTSTSSSADSE